MRRYFGLDAVTVPPAKRPVVTLGVFDGVHRGHLALVEAVVAWAAEVAGSAWLVTFGEHPDGVVAGNAPLAICSLDRRLALVEAAGIEHCWILPFDESMRRIEARDFVNELLVGRLGMAGIALGEEARFGYGGVGSLDLLHELANEGAFGVRCVPDVVWNGQRISSTGIREAVADGRVDDAATMLGRPFATSALVETGDGRGRTIGIPTANLAGPFGLVPREGVYLCRAVTDLGEHYAMTNVGRRPTFDGGSPGPERLTIEAHLLDFEGDLVGHDVELLWLERVRDEERFADAEALVGRIREDLAWARERLPAWDERLRAGLA